MHGKSGVGKSEALLRFVQETPKALLHTVVCAEAKPFTLAGRLMRLLDIGEPNSRDLPSAREKITEAIGPEGMLILDEAQSLVYQNPRGGANYETFSWIQALVTEGCISVVLCGELKLADAVATLPGLNRRLTRPVIIRKVPKGDVETVAAHDGVTDRKAVDELYSVARRHGALGDVRNVLDEARLFAGGGPIELAHIMAAIEDLKLQAMGRERS